MKYKRKLLLTVLVIFIAGCATTQEDWKNANSRNTIKAYEEFINKHPSDKLAKDAKSKIETIKWEDTKSQNTIDAYNTYLIYYPRGAYRKEAKSNILDLEWNKTQKSGTVNAYLGFIIEFPESAQAKEAGRWLENKIKKAVPVSKKELNSITREIIRNIKPFQLSELNELYAPSTSFLPTPHNKKQKSQQTPSSSLTMNSSGFSINQLTSTFVENKIVVEVTLQSLPSSGIVDMFRKYGEKSKRLLRIINPTEKSVPNNLIYQVVNFYDYQGSRKKREYICHIGRCYRF